MSESGPNREQTKPLTLGQVVVDAIEKSFLVAAAMSLVVFAVKTYATIDDPNTSTASILVLCGQAFVIAWLPAFAWFLIASSRVWSDHAFTVAGFLATFVGLAILGVFMYQLTADVALWFQHTPELIAFQNLEHEKVIAAAVGKKRAIQAELEDLENELTKELKLAKDADEKAMVRELFQFGIDKRRADLDQIASDKVTIAERSLRADTSRLAILHAFLTNPVEKHAQDSGVGPAMWGSIWLALITILFSVPVGVGTAIYIEEYRQSGWLARIIQVNINNLAGVPSVVYGILGGFVFVYISRQVHAVHPQVDPFNLLGGGLTLGLLTLPMIIVSAQEAIRTVPGSLRHGAYALGATKWQTIWTVVLPLARPGIMTGTILSISRAIGEAAPLVLFGAQQQVDRNPSLISKFTALPLQIYQWSGLPAVTIEGIEEPIDIWKYNAALASAVLLAILLAISGTAIYLRNRSQRRRD